MHSFASFFRQTTMHSRPPGASALRTLRSAITGLANIDRLYQRSGQPHRAPDPRQRRAAVGHERVVKLAERRTGMRGEPVVAHLANHELAERVRKKHRIERAAHGLLMRIAGVD